MTFDIRQLDGLDYDKAEPLLDDYINGVIREFIESEVGKVHTQAYPTGGFWIGTFIEMAFTYGEFTLAKMSKGDAQLVMANILPRKLTLLDPSEAEDAIPELVAFWTFLKQEYKFRSAGAIAKYLTSIQDKFQDWMFDSTRGGIAKNFMMQGMEAGFDMSSQSDVEAFQAEYNQRIKADPQNNPLIPAEPTVPMTAPPPDVKQFLDLMGVELPEEGEQVNPAELLGKIMDAADQMADLLDANAPTAKQGPGDFLRSLRTDLMGSPLDEDFSLSEQDSTLLETLTISETQPGPLLKDFQTLLEFIGPEGRTVSGKRQQISMKDLAELNQQLSTPIDIDLKRPAQKSYPPIHGLYLLLRATGIVKTVAKGKKQFLVLNPPVYDLWQQFNPTERYCTLLEAWLIRGHGEMLGEDRMGYLTEGNRCIQSWHKIVEKKKHTYNQKRTAQDSFSFYPGLHNLALMEMFGLVNITTGKPDAGKGWRIKSIEALPLGTPVLNLVKNAFLENNMTWPSGVDPSVPYGELQDALQSYFPKWQKTLVLPGSDFRPDRHIFKVSLGKIWRRIAISGDATLEDLSAYILSSVEFDSDHLDSFTYTNEMGRKVEVLHPFAKGGFFSDEEPLHTDAVKIGSLPLSEGSIMEYLFDFGDCWTFQVQLETIEPNPDQIQSTRTKKKKKKAPVGEILEVHGEPPEQYPDSDEDW
ncbi:IS1096 element passenger TnpR family protein [Acaryochloris marina NIES-2412]|uniref:IS1096 element passenger TnpR family protein n=1 Tax=Acaryochloris marina TaxID=155978 RepID=UPI004058BB9D